MVGGFGNPGTPFTLLNELVKQGQNELTIIKNDANESSIGIDKLIEKGRIKKYITSHIGLNRKLVEMMNTGQVEVEFFPQGILAEKIRVGGSGFPGFLTDIGLDTEIIKQEDIIQWQGKRVKIEPALEADFALIHAYQADTIGNLVYNKSAINFSPLMAMAANFTIAEAHSIVQTGELIPEHIHTPFAFVDSVVKANSESSDYNILEHHL